MVPVPLSLCTEQLSSSGAAAVQKELWPGEGQGGFGVVFNASVWDSRDKMYVQTVLVVFITC